MKARGLFVTVRGLMLAVLYVALDVAAVVHAATSPDGRLGAVVFLVMTVFLPLAAGLAWVARGMRGPGKSLY